MEREQDSGLAAADAVSGGGHTPGPWKVWSSLYDGFEACVVYDGGPTLQTVAEVRKYKDAVLLAVMPEMLETLRIIARASQRSESMFGGRMSDVTRVFENITRVSLAAITKATGETADTILAKATGAKADPTKTGAER
jgi:hypothetical protein